MSIAIVYDDTVFPSPSLMELVGSDHFGDIFFRRRRISSRVAELAQSLGFAHFVSQRRSTEAMGIADTLRATGVKRIIHLPSWLAVAREERVRDVLQRLTMVEGNCVGRLEGTAVPLMALGVDIYAKFAPRLMVQGASVLSELPEAWPIEISSGDAFIDIREPGGMIDFLSNAFSVRHFNNIQRSRRVITKRSRDVVKMRAEHDYFYLLPPEMRRWMVMPFDLQIGESDASYRMERMLMLDVGQQWVNGSLGIKDLSDFLEEIFDFLDSRTRRHCARARAESNFDNIYVRKVQERVARLREMPIAAYIDAMLANGTSWRSLNHMLEAYIDLVTPYRKSLPAQEVVGHGDLCFSNILYDKRIALRWCRFSGHDVKLIPTSGVRQE